MELNDDAGSPTRPGTQSRQNSGGASDADRQTVNAVEQEQDTHHRSPGRAARLALQAISRKLGRADVGASDTASTTAFYAGATTAPVAHTIVERGNSERSLNGEQEKARQRRERQRDDDDDFFPIRRQTGSFQSSVARQQPATINTSTGTTSMTTATTSSRDARYARKDPRTVEASSAPLGSVKTRNSDLRRRVRGGTNPTTEEGSSGSVFVEPSREAGRSSRGSSNNPNRDRTGGDNRRRHQRQPSSTTQSTTATNSRVSSRSPLERYMLLSAAVVLAGLVARYLWRQLAGLAGALLILASARRWTGKGGVSPARRGKRRKIEQQLTPPTDGDGGEVRRDAQVDAPVAGGVGVGEWDRAFAGAPAQMRRYWEDGGAECQFFVRGSNYMSDRKKVQCV